MATIWAALLRCGDTAAVSHQTAAELDGLTDEVEDVVHVTVEVTHRVYGHPHGIRVHYAHRLPQSRHPAKSPPRTRIEDTVLDLVDVADSARRAVSWILPAIQRRPTTPERLATALAQRKKIRWRTMTEAILLDATHGAHSMLELQHLRRVERAHALPTGTRQRRHSHGRVIWIDVDHEEYTTRVELDGRVGHLGDGAFRDRRRDNRGVVERNATLRYGHAEVFGSPCAVAAEQALVLADRGWEGTPRSCGDGCTMPATLARISRQRATTPAPHDHVGFVRS